MRIYDRAEIDYFKAKNIDLKYKKSVYHRLNLGITTKIKINYLNLFFILDLIKVMLSFLWIVMRYLHLILHIHLLLFLFYRRRWTNPIGDIKFFRNTWILLNSKHISTHDSNIQGKPLLFVYLPQAINVSSTSSLAFFFHLTTKWRKHSLPYDYDDDYYERRFPSLTLAAPHAKTQTILPNVSTRHRPNTGSPYHRLHPATGEICLLSINRLIARHWPSGRGWFSTLPGTRRLARYCIKTACLSPPWCSLLLYVDAWCRTVKWNHPFQLSRRWDVLSPERTWIFRPRHWPRR